VQKQLGATARIVTVHGREDATCPFADAVEMVDAMRSVGLTVEQHSIRRDNLDRKLFTSAGRSLGDRTQIVLQVAGKYLRPGTPESLERKTVGDFDRRKAIRFPTSNGALVVDYREGFPVRRFEPQETLPKYRSRTKLVEWRDANGTVHPVMNREDWQRRRTPILRHFQRDVGPWPSPLRRVPLDVRVIGESREEGIVRRRITFQSAPDDRVAAWLLIPAKLVEKDEFGPVGAPATGGRDGRRLERFAEVRQDLPDRPRIGDECDEPDVATTRFMLSSRPLLVLGMTIASARGRRCQSVPLTSPTATNTSSPATIRCTVSIVIPARNRLPTTAPATAAATAVPTSGQSNWLQTVATLLA
jgi:hypothetical protein